jgi:hypothetical protein
MAAVTICDEKGCGKVIDGGPYDSFQEDDGPEWSISIKLDEDVDRCESCARKMFARIARGAWDELKRRQPDGGA